MLCGSFAPVAGRHSFWSPPKHYFCRSSASWSPPKHYFCRATVSWRLPKRSRRLLRRSQKLPEASQTLPEALQTLSRRLPGRSRRLPRRSPRFRRLPRRSLWEAGLTGILNPGIVPGSRIPKILQNQWKTVFLGLPLEGLLSGPDHSSLQNTAFLKVPSRGYYQAQITQVSRIQCF